MAKTNKIFGTSQKPRIAVFRSNRFISVQVVDDQKGITLLSDSSKGIKDKGTAVEKALKTGKALGENIKSKKISEVVFDRNSYRYHGQVKSLADGLREAGIKF